MDPKKASLGLQKATEFFFWIEAHLQRHGVFVHQTTLKVSGSFSGESLDGGRSVVTMASITCLMKCLGEEGFVKEALARMKEYHCKPDDVYAYNTIINALCRVGNFKKARFLLQLPITVDMGRIRRRMWEANRMFREMLFRVFAPDVYYSVTNEIERGVEMMGHGVPVSSTNTPLIHALLETRRVAEARGDGGGRVGS
ncbi:pentatricopeptide repeat-containing protein At1g77405-like [Brassica napus]|uniref:pentatricopeptide repeat-containing protein At1g77405-like n=1 Tax=Brassica napus TaxID=3708 RepID=UPI000BBEB437|nr:pentatricopeptide repeat-containing protein At1g77405-like [Brassica napus]